MFDEYTTGFDWAKNFMSNLFGARALNGAENPSRFWAYSGMFLLPCSYAIFFINMSKKIADKNAAVILKYGGLSNICFTFLTIIHRIPSLSLYHCNSEFDPTYHFFIRWSFNWDH